MHDLLKNAVKLIINENKKLGRGEELVAQRPFSDKGNFSCNSENQIRLHDITKSVYSLPYGR